MNVSLDMVIWFGLIVIAIAGWATVFAQRRALLEARKAFQFLGVKDEEARELTDVDYQGEDLIRAMETVLGAMKEQKKAVDKLKAMKPVEPVKKVLK